MSNKYLSAFASLLLLIGTGAQNAFASGPNDGPGTWRQSSEGDPGTTVKVDVYQAPDSVLYTGGDPRTFFVQGYNANIFSVFVKGDAEVITNVGDKLKVNSLRSGNHILFYEVDSYDKGPAGTTLVLKTNSKPSDIGKFTIPVQLKLSSPGMVYIESATDSVTNAGVNTERIRHQVKVVNPAKVESFAVNGTSGSDSGQSRVNLQPGDTAQVTYKALPGNIVSFNGKTLNSPSGSFTYTVRDADENLSLTVWDEFKKLKDTSTILLDVNENPFQHNLKLKSEMRANAMPADNPDNDIDSMESSFRLMQFMHKTAGFHLGYLLTAKHARSLTSSDLVTLIDGAAGSNEVLQLAVGPLFGTELPFGNWVGNVQLGYSSRPWENREVPDYPVVAKTEQNLTVDLSGHQFILEGHASTNLTQQFGYRAFASYSPPVFKEELENKFRIFISAGTQGRTLFRDSKGDFLPQDQWDINLPFQVGGRVVVKPFDWMPLMSVGAYYDVTNNAGVVEVQNIVGF